MPRRIRFEAEAFPYLDALVQTSFWLTGNKSEADGLVCETFAAAYRLWDVTVSTNDFKPWLFKILTRLFSGSFQNHIRREGLRDSRDGERTFPGGRELSAEAIDGLRQRLLAGKLNGSVREAVARLPVDIRIVVILSLLEGFSYREIADIAAIGLDDVRSRLFWGRRFMQRDLFGLVAEVAVISDGRESRGENTFQSKGASS